MTRKPRRIRAGERNSRLTRNGRHRSYRGRRVATATPGPAVAATASRSAVSGGFTSAMPPLPRRCPSAPEGLFRRSLELLFDSSDVRGVLEEVLEALELALPGGAAERGRLEV